MKRNNFLHIVLLVLGLFSFQNIAAQEDAEDDEYVFEEKWDFDEYYIDTTREKIDSVLEYKKDVLKSYSPEKTIPESDDTSQVTWKKFDNNLWKKYQQERDYQEKPKKEKERKKWNVPKFGFEGLGFFATVLKLLVYAAIVLGIGFVIFKILETQFKQNNLVKKENNFFIENLEEKIHEVDLEKLLKKYLHEKDYKTIIRIYYLMVIKTLSNKKIIKWEIQKTNGNYLQEVFETDLFSDFSQLTLIYERIWFGEKQINANDFEGIEPYFKNFLNRIKQPTSV